MTRLVRGQTAEKIALKWLEQHGLRAVSCNYRCRWGEIDLVMLEGDVLVVVEVRSRSNQQFTRPELSINKAKQRKIGLTAQHFRMYNPNLRDMPVRFDIVAVTGYVSPCIRWLPDAFRPDLG